MKLATVCLVIFARLINAENSEHEQDYLRCELTEQEPEPTPPYPVMNYAISADAEESATDESAGDEAGPVREEEERRIDTTESDEEEYSDGKEHGKLLRKLKEPCAVMVQSSIQNPMQSLLRKYKYNSQGALIPSSIQYFIKVPQGYGPPVLVPLNGKSVSHLGGFVRYYKEVPPIPQAW